MMQKRIREKCVLWPDTVPRVDLTGSTYFHVTYLYPVYKAYARWVWLAECECGAELLTLVNQSKSCGCKRKALVQPQELLEDTSTEFDRATICIRGAFMCKYYRECQDERLNNGLLVSTRYSLGCYTKDTDELRILGD
jgi:hypothetical protein